MRLEEFRRLETAVIGAVSRNAVRVHIEVNFMWVTQFDGVVYFL
jgi:hypothetical protein